MMTCVYVIVNRLRPVATCTLVPASHQPAPTIIFFLRQHDLPWPVSNFVSYSRNNQRKLTEKGLRLCSPPPCRWAEEMNLSILLNFFFFFPPANPVYPAGKQNHFETVGLLEPTCLGMQQRLFLALCFLAFLLGPAKAQNDCVDKDGGLLKLLVRVVQFESDHYDFWSRDMRVGIGPSNECGLKTDTADWACSGLWCRTSFEKCDQTDGTIGFSQNKWTDVDLVWKSDCRGDTTQTLTVILLEDDPIGDDKEMEQEVTIPR